MDGSIDAGVEGKEAARTYLEAMFTSFPDMHFDYTIHTSVDGLKAAVGWHLTATMQERMDPPGYAATHQPVDLRGASLYEFEDGSCTTPSSSHASSRRSREATGWP